MIIMALATKPAPQATRGMWKTPASKAWWGWLLPCLVLYGGVYAWYLNALSTQRFPGPFNDPLRFFGIIAFLLVILTASYTLRRRFVRGLPGKAQDWLWMHVWVGITAVLIAFLHENYIHVLHDYCTNLSCLTQQDAGTAALIALIILVASGILGRLLDRWQTAMIARDAQFNGEGIAQALAERILELEYTVERLCAGKSEPFKQYCMQALDSGSIATPGASVIPTLAPAEQKDFQTAYATLTTYTSLGKSLKRQQQARRIMRAWRYAHMVLATLALLVILYHGVLELLVNVLHVVHA
jgi:hypothetical protein